MRTDVMDGWVAAVLGITVSSGRPAGRVSLVRLGKSRLQWVAARRNAVAGLTLLRDEIATQFAADTDQAVALDKALARLRGHAETLNTVLEDQLDAVLNTPEPKRRDLVATARGTLGEIVAFLRDDPVVANLDHNEVLPDLVVVAPMRGALADISSALG